MATVTILNDIVHADFPTSLDIQKAWGIEQLDLRGAVFGKSFLDLDENEAGAAVEAIRSRGLLVYCLSSGLFFDDLEKGEAHFRESHLGQVDRLIEAANRFKPKVVRLLSARFAERASVPDSVAYIAERYPWLLALYREAIDRIRAAGHRATIENEVHNCILSKPREIIDFFDALERKDGVTFTYDVQNLWVMGTFPTMDVYRELAPLIGYYHLKGGMAGEDGKTLQWSSSLEDASWPVVDMTARLVEDGRSPVICLNPSHGALKDGYDYRDLHKRNLDFLRERIPGVR
ncbi:TIM barrel protein [Paenibacillus sp.]|uniref:TIM barrel protein n=1 Tax=Paenibacillus sp. TaxID=58172 RepID=UPI002D60EFFC|nr:TIM barrel protein [Paenibacillus sp.]HZG55924.1 TIM barrel protein [Paenibacillus sp.]